MRIDAHHHFWKYSAEEYGWIDESMAIIRRDFLPADLERATAAAGIDAVVSVQARQSLEETDWLLSMAGQNRWIRGIVGWVPLCRPDVQSHLEKVSAQPKLRAVRHVVQGEPAGFMLRDDFNRGISLLPQYKLAYDILIFERQLLEAIEFVDRHPNQVFILDHIAKPQIKKHLLSPWDRHIREMAKRPNVYCKLSGMVTEADYTKWTPEQLKPYMQTVLEAFTPQRLMYGSDWPVCLVATGYSHWLRIVEQFAGGLSHAEQHALFGQTAARAYSLDLS